MNSDIQKAVEIIEQRIVNLQQIKSMLLAEFGADSASISSATILQPTSHSSGNGNGSGSQTRKDQLIKFLAERGPSRRGTILADSGIPKGTIANLLNQEEFVRRSDGKWQVDLATSSASQETTH